MRPLPSPHKALHVLYEAVNALPPALRHEVAQRLQREAALSLACMEDSAVPAAHAEVAEAATLLSGAVERGDILLPAEWRL